MEQNKDQSGAAVRGEAVETQPGSPNFDGAAAYEAFLDAGGYGAQLVPKWAGQFDTHQQWVNKAASWLRSPDWNRPVCVDSLGRRMAIGMDMAKARDEGTFPVRYFWECELTSVPARAADAPSEPSEKFGLLRIADNGKSVTVVADERFWSGDCSIPDGMYRIVSDVAADALDSQPAESAELNGWQPIETAPTVKGDYFFCSIAWGPEGEQLTGDGMRWNGRWFVAPVFHALGKERKCEHREIEVQPTHWRPSCPAPASSQPTDGGVRNG